MLANCLLFSPCTVPILMKAGRNACALDLLLETYERIFIATLMIFSSHFVINHILLELTLVLFFNMQAQHENRPLHSQNASSQCDELSLRGPLRLNECNLNSSVLSHWDKTWHRHSNEPESTVVNHIQQIPHATMQGHSENL
jgi:hypothetical protein